MMRGLNFFTFLFLLCQCFTYALSSEATQYKTIVELTSAIQEHLLSLRNSDWGWDFGNTPRAVIALSLANQTFFRSEDVQATLIKKQLQLEITLSMARQHKEAISAGKLALYINALLAICQDPHNFFEFNLVRKMKRIEIISNYEEALKALALCNAGHHLHKHDILSLNKLLQNNSAQHNSDAKAIALMALICNDQLYPNTFVKSMLHEPIEFIKSQQRVDGSFGNIYSTGLALQVLISMGDFEKNWKFDQAIRYTMSQYEKINAHSNFLSCFFILPVLNLKSMVHLRTIDCNFSTESDINKFETSTLPLISENNVWAVTFDTISSHSHPMNAVTYSIKCDSCKFQNVTLSTVVMIHDGETLQHVMDKAALSDDRFHYSAKNTAAGFYVQSMAGLANDISNNKYWMIYQQENVNKYKLLNKGVTMIQPKNDEHYIFWYKQV